VSLPRNGDRPIRVRRDLDRVHELRSGVEHGTPWFRIVYRREEKPPASVKITGDLTTQVAFGDIGLPAGEFPKIAEAVRTIINSFLAEFRGA
jgi:hypothetical protein